MIDYITSGPVVVMALQGQRCLEIARALMGRTFGYEAAPGTIRGDFGASGRHNLVHGSDSPESAATEIALFFADDELVDYSLAADRWVYPGDDSQSLSQ